MRRVCHSSREIVPEVESLSRRGPLTCIDILSTSLIGKLRRELDEWWQWSSGRCDGEWIGSKYDTIRLVTLDSFEISEMLMLYMSWKISSMHRNVSRPSMKP